MSKAKEILAEDLIVGDVIALPAEFQEYLVLGTVDDEAAATSDAVIVTLCPTKGPFRKLSGCLRANNTDKLVYFRKAPRQRFWKKALYWLMGLKPTTAA